MEFHLTLTLLVLGALSCGGDGADWPQWRGPAGAAAWNETEVLQTFPAGGLRVEWRAPVSFGWSSPIVASGRVYVVDALQEKPRATERVHCFDAATGRELWTHAYAVEYPDWAFQEDQQLSPIPTPIARDGKLYTLGASAELRCLDAADGRLLWQHELSKELGLKEIPGPAASPIIEDGLLIVSPGGRAEPTLLAFDRETGQERWRALADHHASSTPAVVTAGKVRQLILWAREAVTSLSPSSGEVYWRERMPSDASHYSVATPVPCGTARVLVSGVMFQLDPEKPAATVLWPEQSTASRRILSSTSTPLYAEGYVYAPKTGGSLVCLEAASGRQLWQQEAVYSRHSGGTLTLIQNGDTVLGFTDAGELLRARLSPQGYEEISRTKLIEPLYKWSGAKVTWSAPAYSNGHVLVRNGAEIICASLRAK